VIRYSAVIPAYNEEKTIAAAIRQTAGFFRTLGEPFEIIVVNDGSQDRTGVEAERMRDEVPELKVLNRAENFGKGGAVKKGVLEAAGEWILFLDADLATDPSEFKKFLPLLEQHDVLIGSRYVRGGSVKTPQPVLRVIAGKIFNLIVRLYLGLNFADTQCGFKAFSRRAQNIFASLHTTGWAFDVELLFKAKRLALAVAEVPIVWDDKRESRVKFGDFWHIMRELRRIKKEYRI
jgi:glycosyltransferase involved in cell wall biosynthesis